jgi:hypothetical protein
MNKAKEEKPLELNKSYYISNLFLNENLTHNQKVKYGNEIKKKINIKDISTNDIISIVENIVKASIKVTDTVILDSIIKITNRPTIESIPKNKITSCLKLLLDHKCITTNTYNFLCEINSQYKIDSNGVNTVEYIIQLAASRVTDINFTINNKEIKVKNITEKTKTKIVEIIKITNNGLYNDYYKINENQIDYLIDNLTILKEIADTKTKKIIENVLNSNISDLSIFKKQIAEIESRIKYMTIHQSNEMNQISNSFSNFNKDTCIIDIYTKKGTIKTNNIEYEIDNFELLKNQINISTSKLLVYSVHKLDFKNNISKFTFSEYAEMRGIDKNQVNRNKLKQDIDIFKRIGSITYKSINKKDNDLILNTLVYKAVYKNGNVVIEFNPEFVEGLKNTYMYFPKSLMKLNGKEFKNVFLLGWYFFSQFRINFTTTLTRSVKKCLEQLPLPKKEDIKDRMYQRRLIEPFENIIEALGNEIPELYITFDRDYKNIDEFLTSNIIIELKESRISQLYIDQQRKKNAKNIKYNKENKESNIKLCNQYIQEGKTDKEISELLKKDMRTIRRYKADIEKRSPYKNNNNNIKN